MTTAAAARFRDRVLTEWLVYAVPYEGLINACKRKDTSAENVQRECLEALGRLRVFHTTRIEALQALLASWEAKLRRLEKSEPFAATPSHRALTRQKRPSALSLCAAVDAEGKSCGSGSPPTTPKAAMPRVKRPSSTLIDCSHSPAPSPMMRGKVGGGRSRPPSSSPDLSSSGEPGLFLGLAGTAPPPLSPRLFASSSASFIGLPAGFSSCGTPRRGIAVAASSSPLGTPSHYPRRDNNKAKRPLMPAEQTLFVRIRKAVADIHHELSLLREFLSVNREGMEDIVRRRLKRKLKTEAATDALEKRLREEFSFLCYDGAAKEKEKTEAPTSADLQLLIAKTSALTDRVKALEPLHSSWKSTAVFTIGTFDMRHHGHENLLRAMRAFGNTCIAGIHDDQSYELLKGNPPVDALQSRIEGIAPLCDFVFVIDSTDPTVAMQQAVADFVDMMKQQQTQQPGAGPASDGQAGGQTGGQADEDDSTLISQSCVYVRGDDMPLFPGREWVESVMPVVLLPRTELVSSSFVKMVAEAQSRSSAAADADAEPALTEEAIEDEDENGDQDDDGSQNDDEDEEQDGEEGEEGRDSFVNAAFSSPSLPAPGSPPLLSLSDLILGARSGAGAARAFEATSEDEQEQTSETGRKTEERTHTSSTIFTLPPSSPSSSSSRGPVRVPPLPSLPAAGANGAVISASASPAAGRGTSTAVGDTGIGLFVDLESKSGGTSNGNAASGTVSLRKPSPGSVLIPCSDILLGASSSSSLHTSDSAVSAASGASGVAPSTALGSANRFSTPGSHNVSAAAATSAGLPPLSDAASSGNRSAAAVHSARRSLLIKPSPAALAMAFAAFDSTGKPVVVSPLPSSPSRVPLLPATTASADASPSASNAANAAATHLPATLSASSASASASGVVSALQPTSLATAFERSSK